MSSTTIGSGQVQAASYSPPPFVSAEYHTGQRLQHSVQQLGSWTAPQHRPSYSPWNVGPLPRQQNYYSGPYPSVDYGMQQYTYAVQQSTQVPRSSVSNAVYPTTASTQMQNPSVMILQRSAGSESAGPRPLGSL